VDGRPVKTVEGVINRLGLVRLGQEIKLRLLRDKRELEITTTVAAINDLHPLLVGATFEDAVTPRGRRFVVIGEIRDGSKLDQLGLRPGDAVLSVDRKEIASVDDLKRVLNPSDKRLLLLIQRGRKTDYVEVR
ncbi:MAG: hypothetical protein KTR33_00560, partial [Gammaproteobacteria bacterium]|nr:hypothetical protein [Gammaproteobacteria bacterium]